MRLRILSNMCTSLSLLLLLIVAPTASATATTEDTEPLTERATENLVAYAKIFGYVRFFHPCDASLDLDWDRFVTGGVMAVEGASDEEELAEILSELFYDIAPAVQIWAGGVDDAPDPVDLKDGTSPDEVISIAHQGLGMQLLRHDQDPATARSLYVSQLKIQPRPVAPSPEKDTWMQEVGGGVSCRVPLYLYRHNETTLPESLDSPSLEDIPVTPDHRTVRLAAVIMGWNVLQHFYPYFDVIEAPWADALLAGLRDAAQDKDATECFETMEQLVAKIGDGHGNVYHNATRQGHVMPLVVEWVDGVMVVRKALEDAVGEVWPGDAVVSFNGTSIEELFEHDATRISYGTEGWLRHKSLARILGATGPGQDVLEIEGIDGKKREVRLDRMPFSQSLKGDRPDQGAELSPGIYYFDLDRAESETLQEHLETFADADGVVFDMRGYPGGAGYDLFPHLCDELTHSAWWNVPSYPKPDQVDVEFSRSHWNIQPKAPRIRAQLAFLTDGRAISYAESCMGIVEHYKLGEIIGAPTAGANGNINRRMLPGGYFIVWTGMKVTKHDDSQHHRIGNLPTIPYTPTREGIADGRDELLEKALEVLEEKIDSDADQR